MGLIWMVNQTHQPAVSCCYKPIAPAQALLVIEHLVKQGSEQCVTLARDLMPLIKNLEGFQFEGADKKDHGVNVRLR